MKKGMLISAGILVVGIVIGWSAWVAAGEKETKSCPLMAKKGTHAFALIGNELICPVLGSKFRISEKTVYSRYKGKCYAFCCPECKEPFNKNPGKYISKEVKSKEHKKPHH